MRGQKVNNTESPWGLGERSALLRRGAKNAIGIGKAKIMIYMQWKWYKRMFRRGFVDRSQSSTKEG